MSVAVQGDIGGGGGWWHTWPRCFPVQPSQKAMGMCFSQTQCLQFYTDKIDNKVKHVIQILILWGHIQDESGAPSTS